MFPAHAGMNRNGGLITDFQKDVPRTRGDEPFLAYIFLLTYKCSPHTRG